jgi:cytochrome bd-type quinol oxidase subunit 1
LLQLELFLTRIFSVTMWYHFAFMAISLAMFGIAAGAVLMEVVKRREPHSTLANAGLLFALTSAVCFTCQLYIPADPE